MRINHRFQTAIQRVRAAADKTHHITLAGGMHGGIQAFKAALFYLLQQLNAYCGPSIRINFTPALHSRNRRSTDLLGIGLWVINAQRQLRIR